MQDDSGQWRISFTKGQAGLLLEFADEMVKHLLPTYINTDTGPIVPLISIDGAAAIQEVGRTRQRYPALKTPVAYTPPASWGQSKKMPMTAPPVQKRGKPAGRDSKMAAHTDTGKQWGNLG